MIIFGGDKPIEDNFGKAKFFGPNILATMLCLALDSVVTLKHGNGFHRLPRPDLAVVSPDVIIEENEFSHGVPRGFEKAMLAFVSITFLLSSSQLVEIKIRSSGRWKIRRWTAGLHTTFQIICVNCVFLRLRMYL